MIPQIAAEGASFHGAFMYYFHDKNAQTRNRIGFTETINMLTDSVDLAWKVMAFTAKAANQLKKASGQKATGAKLKKPVFAYSLAWHPEQKPTKEEMLNAAKESLQVLGLEEHEAMIAEHLDEPHPHLHLVVNKTHPRTGLVAKLKYTKDKLSYFAHKLERKEGKMYCPQREENRSKREKGEKAKYVDPVVAEAWQISRDGGGFKSNLEDRGYQLAQGRKCIVIVDPRGKPSNAARTLGIKTKEFRNRLGKSEIESLKSFEEATEDLQNVAQRAQQRVHQNAAKNGRLKDFEERKAVALADLQRTQWDEISALSLRHDRKIVAAKKELGAFYDLANQEKAIAKLEAKQEKSGFFQKLFGIHRRRDTELHQLKAGLDDARYRFDEAINKLNNEKAHAVTELKAHQVEQKLRMEANFEQWKPCRVAKTKEQSLAPERNNTRGYEGPDFER